MTRTCKVTVYGLVQGIGYRPFVAGLAEELNIAGTVRNAGGIVIIYASGSMEAMDELIHRLRYFSPPGAQVDRVIVDELSDSALVCGKNQSFSIVESEHHKDGLRMLPYDLPICKNCERELKDPQNRRYRYPFISCVSCGPRYSILEKIPYDRDTITMKKFSMCVKCQKEYTEKGNIRRHAQTISCPDCGPTLCMQTKERAVCDNVLALQETIALIKKGKIAAIKDIGGYHFAFRPDLREPSMRLRQFKNREKKPFAVMFLSVDAAREYCEISVAEQQLLESDARPIVLLEKKKDFVPEVCGESRYMGVMLPCNPLQILILEETGPLVMTSGNRGGEPIIINEKDMLALMDAGCPDVVLAHDREIRTPLDDSIYQVIPMKHSKKNWIQVMRRARGIVPSPIYIERTQPKEVLAAGGDLKAVFGFGKENAVFLSQHFGDLEDWKAQRARMEAIEHMRELFDFQEQIRVGDLHPGYFSAKGADRRFQHHHAHIASVIAEWKLTGKILGVSFDGTGYGTDHTIWGSEFLVCQENVFERAGSLMPVKLLGQNEGAKNARVTLECMLLAAYQRGLIEEPLVHPVRKCAWEQEINTVYSSSMGRLFDAVCALLGIKEENSYEGECPIALERCAVEGKKAYPIHMDVIKKDGRWQADGVKCIVDLLTAKEQGIDRENLALGFHMAVGQMIAEICNKIADEQQIKQIALSGGTFLNRILLQNTVELLEKEGFQVYGNVQVPTGDGGLALGQLYLASWEN